MRDPSIPILLLAGASLLVLACNPTDPRVSGADHVWEPVTVSFRGPETSESATEPNPFLDYRLQVRFTGPNGRTYRVPGFFAGDGVGGEEGNVWKVRFAPDEPGRWTYAASFRTGDDVAVSLDREAGEPTAFDRAAGSFTVRAAPDTAPSFYRWGRLEYADGHYLKFREGPHWIKGGTDSPENFLAYGGFDATPSSHDYGAHVADWRPGDPTWRDGRGKGIIGAINALAEARVNSIYFLTMNVGGDGQDVWPWAGEIDPAGSEENDNLHFDLSKLRQWDIVFRHAQRRGLFLHFVLNEAEAPNKKELDGGELGPERKLYYRELIARFGHHPALQWNISEEFNLDYDLGADRVRAFARYIRGVDPYDHPVTVHPKPGDPVGTLAFTFGDTLWSIASVQTNMRRVDSLTEAFRRETEAAGRPLPVGMDEFSVDVGQERNFDPVNRPHLQRRQRIWPIYLSGGMLEFKLEDRLETDRFDTTPLSDLWRFTWYARRFVENLPFWKMNPADSLLTGEGRIEVGLGNGNSFMQGGQVFALPDSVYAVYLPAAEPAGRIDLSSASGSYRKRWYDPRNGRFVGKPASLRGGASVALGTPPESPSSDWVVLIERE